MQRTKHLHDYLDFTKEEFSLKHELGYRGKANWEVKLMIFVLTSAK